MQNHSKDNLFLRIISHLVALLVKLQFNLMKDNQLREEEEVSLLAHQQLDNSQNYSEQSNKSETLKITTKECPHPEAQASLLSRLTFWWANQLALVGYRKTLTLQDLWPLDPRLTSENVSEKFSSNLASDVRSLPDLPEDDLEEKGEDKEEAGNDSVFKSAMLLIRSPGVIWTILRTFKQSLLLYTFVYFLTECGTFTMPQLVKSLISFVSNSTPHSSMDHSATESSDSLLYGLSLAILIFLLSNVKQVVYKYNAYYSEMITMRIQSALYSAIYRKSLRLSSAARSKFTTGEVQNLISTYVESVVGLGLQLHWIWSIPLQIGLTVYLLWMELGVAMLAGVVVITGTLITNSWSVKYENRLYNRQSIVCDERMKVLNEVVNGIRVIKLYGWELPFIGKISRLRADEVDIGREIMNFHTWNSLLYSCSSFLTFLLTFTVYMLLDPSNQLTPEKIFVSLFFFQTLRGALGSLPYELSNLNHIAVAVKKLNRFFAASELGDYIQRNESHDHSVEIQNGSFTWDQKNKQENGKVILDGIDLKIKKGELVAIVGQVGVGKSSLLSAILGSMELVHGEVSVSKSESIAYVSQQAWICNATIRENILFGSKMSKHRYESILEACALSEDLKTLPGGDQTEIGEKGINLSGGQKQRVAIARACYSNSSLMLMDDPLSAVDAHVGRHIFRHVLSSSGLLRNRTRILVTNQIAFLSEVDRIIVLSNGEIQEVGTYQQLIGNQVGYFSKLAKEHSTTNISEASSLSGIESPQTVRQLSRQESTHPEEASEESQEGKGKLIEEEEPETGRVKLSVYLRYFESVSWRFIGFTVIAMFITEAASTGSDVWLALWSGDSSSSELAPDKSLPNKRLAVYALLGVCQAVFTFAGMKSLSAGTLKGSVRFHTDLLDRVMRSPMKFFDTTPLGRIVSRFSKDIDSVDGGLVWNIDAILNCLFSVISSLGIMLFKVPILLVVIAPISLIYYLIQSVFINTTRQLSRLRGVYQSPIYSHFSETLYGLDTIRAFGCGDRFADKCSQLVDTFQRVNFPSFIISEWLSLRLEFLGSLVQLFATLLMVASKDTFEAGFVGLIVTQSAYITSYLRWVVSCFMSLEKNLVAVERIDEYCKNEPEREWTRQKNENPELPDGWPNKGEIEFVDYSLRYREGMDLVLKEVSFKVRGGEKVGIVGRTGAGKSSLTLALFRIVEAAGGSILLDGVSIEKIGLHELRRVLSIIPQDPVLFSGSIRSNLDPFGLQRDEDLHSALSQCHLSQLISSHEKGLDYPISENGSNLSVGQRQLVCLARAILRRTRILVLDEATAAIDLQTDALIQQTIREQFAHCTVLTIAHRLNTVLDSDRVLFMHQGRVAEFDTPTNLLADPSSQFYALAKEVNIV